MKDFTAADAIKKAQEYFGWKHEPIEVRFHNGCYAVLYSIIGVALGYDNEVAEEIDPSEFDKIRSQSIRCD